MMNGLILLLTIFAATSLGIYAGYGMVCGILQLMAHRSEPESAGHILVTSQAHGGD